MQRASLLRLLPILLFALAALAPPARAEVKGDPLKLAVGDMQLVYHPYGGVKLTVFGIPMIKGTSMYFMKPKWVDKFYSEQDNPYLLDKAVVEPYQGGKRVTLTQSLPKEFDSPVEGTTVFTLLPDNTFSVTQDFIFTKDEPAIMEWQVGALNPSPMIGCAYTVERNGKKTEGVIPAEAAGSALEETTYARAFDSVVIDSRIGPIRIESNRTDDLTLFDYRKNVWANADNPILWFGVLGRSIEFNKPYRYTVAFHFPKTLEAVSTTTAAARVDVNTVAVSDAQTPNWGQDYLIPKPKSLAFGTGRFALTSKTRIYVGSKPGEGIENALDFFLDELRDTYKIEPKVVRKDVAAADLPKGAIVLGESTRFDAPAAACKSFGLAMPDHEEGYAIHIDDDTAVVAANTDRGVFYGLTSLVQLIQVDEGGASLKGVDIVDYPSLDYRGVHCLSAKDGGDEIAKALRTLLARFKMNSLVFECEYIIWDGHEDLTHPKYGMTKKEARKVVDAARKYFIDIAPLVQSLGHSEWIFTNGKNLDIAEDPETPYAYNPTNPDTYTFIFDVYQQALDLFQPRYFHIGHDEVTMRGRFPWRSKDSGKTTTDLIIGDINTLHTWFKEKNVRVMMWGDMFLHADEATDAHFAPSLEEAKQRRSLLPKDVIITDWHYAAAKPEEYISIKLWNDLGFDTIGSGWDNPVNIRNLAGACVNEKATGYLQTTWAGFNFKIDNNEESWPQYWAYILAAHYSWSGDTTPHYDLPFSAKEKFLDAWFGRKPLLHKRAGYTLDLSAVANRKLEDNAAGEGWLGYGPDFDFSALPTGALRAGETVFNLAKNDKGESALILAGRFNPKGQYPEAVELGVEPVKAAEIHFLMNTAHRGNEKAKVGEIVVGYADGSRASTDLVYGKNIFAYYDTRIGEEARIAWEGQAKGGRAIYAWDLRWKNPHPGRKIASISLRSSGTEASPILFAATLVSPEKPRSKFLGLF